MLFFFNDTATTEIYTLSLHDALPNWYVFPAVEKLAKIRHTSERTIQRHIRELIKAKLLTRIRQRNKPSILDRKSTRLNSSHANYLVCRLLLEKKTHHYRHFFAFYSEF